MKCCIWIGAITVLVASCIAGMVFGPDTPDREIARLNRQIETDLPLGTSRVEVEKWLTNRPDFDIFSDAANHPQLLRGTAGRGYFWYWSGDLTIFFSFDGQDRLVNHHIEFEEFPL
jgi:hypothetical protein